MSNTISGLGYTLRRGFEDSFFGLVQRRVHYRSVYCLGWVDLSRKMSDIAEAGTGAMACELYTFDSCSRFHVAYDTHDMCAPCRHKEGHQECTRDSNCQYCINWSDIEWSLFERNLQRKGYRRQKKLDKTQLQSLWKTPWQLALKIQKTRQQRNQRWKILEVSLSLLTKSRPKGFLSRGIWTMRCHQHLPRGWREMVIGVTGAWNRCSDSGQDDSHRERHFHKRSSSSWSSKGNLAGSGSSRSCSSTESQADCPAGVASSRNWTTRDEGPAGVGSSQSRTTSDRSPAEVGSSRNRTTMGKGPAGANSSWSSTTADHPAGVASWGDRTTTDKHSGRGSSGSHTSKSGASAGAVSLGDRTAANWASGHRTSSSRKEGYSAVKSSRVRAGSENLTTVDSWAGVGSQSLTTAKSQGAISSGNWTSSDNSRDQSSGSISFGSWGHCRCQSSWSWFTAELVCRGLPWLPPGGTDLSGQDAVCLHSYSN